MIPTESTQEVSGTPEYKSQRNKRKHCFGISSCEKDKKFSTENTPQISDEFPPIGNIVINENLTPESDSYRSWADIMDEEDRKENLPKPVSDLNKETKNLSFRSRRRLALTSLADKVTDKDYKENTKGSYVASPGRKSILTDMEKIQKRQRQIDIGKNTLEYGNYIKIVPRCKREKIHPSTPDKYQVCSTRSWQGQLKVWRRKLHMFDSPETAAEFECQINSILGSSNKDVSHTWITSSGSQEQSVSQEDDSKECTYNNHTPL